MVGEEGSSMIESASVHVDFLALIKMNRFSFYGRILVGSTLDFFEDLCKSFNSYLKHNCLFQIDSLPL